MQLRTFAALLALVPITMFPGAVGGHCEDPYLDRDTEELRVNDPVTGDVIFYVDVDPMYGLSVVSLVVYEETNGIPHLQRKDGDEGSPRWLHQDDTCHGKIAADTLIFIAQRAVR